jgi:hypothetical protein
MDEYSEIFRAKVTKFAENLFDVMETYYNVSSYELQNDVMGGKYYQDLIIYFADPEDRGNHMGIKFMLGWVGTDDHPVLSYFSANPYLIRAHWRWTEYLINHLDQVKPEFTSERDIPRLAIQVTKQMFNHEALRRAQEDFRIEIRRIRDPEKIAAMFFAFHKMNSMFKTTQPR